MQNSVLGRSTNLIRAISTINPALRFPAVLADRLDEEGNLDGLVQMHPAVAEHDVALIAFERRFPFYSHRTELT